jgi:hypothetical protein
MRHVKRSKGPEFVPKLRDIVGLYVDPPAHAVVTSVDGKSQIQSLPPPRFRPPPQLEPPEDNGRALGGDRLLSDGDRFLDYSAGTPWRASCCLSALITWPRATASR